MCGHFFYFKEMKVMSSSRREKVVSVTETLLMVVKHDYLNVCECVSVCLCVCVCVCREVALLFDI